MSGKSASNPSPRERRHLIRSGLTDLQCAQVATLVESCLEQARQWLGLALPCPEIRFDLAGRAAGQYRCTRTGPGRHAHSLRFNPYLLQRHFRDSLESTVPHEVAHYVVAARFGAGRTRPHGAEWKETMVLFGAEPEVTHRYGMEGVPVRRQQRWVYRCDCRRHQLSTTRHHRVLGGTTYRCTSCGGALFPVGEPDGE